LILAGPVDSAALDAFRSDFSGALADSAFRPAPATSWCAIRFGQSRSRTISRIFRRWVALPDETAHMNVAIFYDARAVAGDTQLLTTAKAALIDLIRGVSRPLPGSFRRRAVDAFPTPDRAVQQPGHVPRAKADALDLKKGGSFPIVHGVRSLAIEHGLLETSTDKAHSRGCAKSASCKPTSPAS